jgi:hypothetical protein
LLSSRFRYFWQRWGKDILRIFDRQKGPARTFAAVFELPTVAPYYKRVSASFCDANVLLMSSRSVAYGSGNRDRSPRAAKPAGLTPATACTCGHQI